MTERNDTPEVCRWCNQLPATARFVRADGQEAPVCDICRFGLYLRAAAIEKGVDSGLARRIVANTMRRMAVSINPKPEE